MITIGDRVAIDPRVTFIYSSFFNKSIIRMYSPVEHSPIIIEDEVLIDTGAIIFPNLTIGKDEIVGACAKVTRDDPPFSIVVGIPAKLLRKLSGQKDSNNPEGLSS